MTPGGLLVTGNYMYRLNGFDWFESEAEFVYGGGGRGCAGEPAETLQCDHGLATGTAMAFTVGLRRFLKAQGRFDPYFRLGLSLRRISFAADELRGIAFPIVFGGGVRTKVHPTTSVVVGGVVQFGPAWFNRGLGVEPQVALLLVGGAEFGLD